MSIAIRPYLVQEASDNMAVETLKSTKCSLFFPFDETSGTTITDLANSTPIVVTDSSAVFDSPFGVKCGTIAGAPTTGTIPDIKSHFIFVISTRVVTTVSFYLLQVGLSTYIKLTESQAVCDLPGAGNGATTSISSASPVDGDLVTCAAILYGSTLYHYRSVNRAGMSEVSTADATAFLAAITDDSFELDNSIQVHSNVIRQTAYGAALLTYAANEMPALDTIVSALDTIDTWWGKGRKAIPSELL